MEVTAVDSVVLN